MILYCVRHGETLFNASGRIQGQTDSELSARGREQGRAVAVALASESIEAVYSSPLRRARDAAEQIAAALHLEVRIDPRLMEINAGVFQGFDWTEIESRYPAESRRWKSQDPDFRIPEGETRRELIARACAAFDDLREAGHRQAVVVSHGGLLAAALKGLLEIPAERNPFSLSNGSISRLAWDKDFKLLTLNQTEHLHGLVGGGGDL